LFDAHFYIRTRENDDVSSNDPRVSVLHKTWVIECIKNRRLVALYPYLDDANGGRFAHLSSEDRDDAELFRAMVSCTKDDMFQMLHRKVSSFSHASRICHHSSNLL